MPSGEAWITTAPPKVVMGKGNIEAQKYGKLWEMNEYRRISPGEGWVDLFLDVAKPILGCTISDLGCGTGRAGYKIASRGYNIALVDFTRNCLDENVREKLGEYFVKADLEQPLPITTAYAFCADVMEHIPTENVDRVLNNILLSAKDCFLSISTYEDAHGLLIGEKLHLTVKPFSWWKQKFLDRNCVIHFEMELPGITLFYVSAWQDGQTVVDSGEINESHERIRENVRFNCSQGWEQVKPHETNDIEMMILGGGSSLNDFVDEIKQNRADGVKCVTLNGTYNWAAHHGITPSAQIVVDARPFNARFVQPITDITKYLIASQCHPSVFEGLPKDRTFIWHTTTDLIEDILKAKYEHYWPIPGGSTVLLRAIPLLRMLGYRKFILYGCDSCVLDKNIHAYQQPENEKDQILPVVIGGKTFRCTPWMASQATEFMSLIRFLGNEIELEIKGDGLLKWILEYAASMADEQEGEPIEFTDR